MPKLTVVYYNSAFYVSDIEWHDPSYAIRQEFNRAPGRFEWIGSRGWFHNDTCKTRYTAIESILGRSNLPSYDGEFDVIEVTEDQRLLVMAPVFETVQRAFLSGV